MVRKDVVRNRMKLVEAARHVFAERGFGATLDDVAHHAGVGVGTAYRHFPNKRALAAEVLADATEAIALDARAALEIEDPWEALVAFFVLSVAASPRIGACTRRSRAWGTTSCRRGSGRTSSSPSSGSSIARSPREWYGRMPPLPTSR